MESVTKCPDRPQMGQPRKYMRPELKLPVYVSMTECNRRTGIPMEVLRTAKRHGCPGLSGSTVDLNQFLPWWFMHDDNAEMQADWIKRDKRAAALIKEKTLEKMCNKVIDFQVVTRFIHRMTGEFFFSELDRMANEFPPAFKGKDEVSIYAEMKKQITNIKKKMQAQLARWKTEKGEVE